MNGCGGESIKVEVSATHADGGYEALVTKAMQRMSDMLPDAAFQRHKSDCGGIGGLASSENEWYIGCAHSGISGGGQSIEGVFTFIRNGSEETF